VKIGPYDFPDDLYYDKNHGWARVEGNSVTMGLSDFAQKLAKEIVYAEVPRANRAVEQGKPFMSVESGKWVGRVFALVSGRVTHSNAELEVTPTLINESPYGDGWLVKVEASNLEPELKNLMRTSDPAFAEFIKSEMTKYKAE
jgi:glycine cleavage system H protein